MILVAANAGAEIKPEASMADATAERNTRLCIMSLLDVVLSSCGGEHSLGRIERSIFRMPLE